MIKWNLEKLSSINEETEYDKYQKKIPRGVKSKINNFQSGRNIKVFIEESAKRII